MGARLSTLLRAFVANGFVAPAHLPLAVAMVLSATIRLPFSALDRLHLGVAGSEIPPAAPVFIVGHWRSGTNCISTT